MQVYNKWLMVPLYSITLLFIVLLQSPAQAAQEKFSTNDFAHWLDAAYLAQASYQSISSIKSILEAKGYDITRSGQLDGYSVAYTLATNTKNRQHLIIVRGTSNIKNVVVDAAFVLVPDSITGIDIHQGFLLSARDIYQQILPDIRAGYTITTVGHSLGGAAAIILAMMLDAHAYPIDEVITFGQPKVTNVSGSRKFKHLNIHRLVTPKDIVPLLPPIDPMDLMNFSIFWHQGTEIILYEDERYAVLSGMDSMLRAADFLNDVPEQKHVNSHFMSTYIDHLKAKVTSVKEVDYQSDFRFSDWFGGAAEN